MVRRASQLFFPTLRDDPADAEAISHKLLVRGAFIRQVSAGLWTFLPLGWRVHEKIVQIIREEMDAIGAQEMLMPVLTPAELWKATGRYAIPEVFKLRDRNDREFVLPMTHEETTAFHAREVLDADVVAPTRRAGDHHRPALTKAERLQDLPGDLDLLHRVGRE